MLKLKFSERQGKHKVVNMLFRVSDDDDGHVNKNRLPAVDSAVDSSNYSIQESSAHFVNDQTSRLV
ncbi:hypothetical protein RUND412_007379 [Rhizina undulata]